MAKKKSKGILMLALGHPNYGKMAANLAMSIKYSNPDVKIAIAHEGRALSHLNEFQKGLFDKLIDIPDEAYKVHGLPVYIKAKAWMYDLSPWDETIFLDVDMIWHPNKSIEPLFLKTDFTIKNSGNFDLKSKVINPDFSWWCKIEDVKSHYKKGVYYACSSEFVFFKKGAKAKKLFDKVKKLYDNLPIAYRRFAGYAPDELAFSLAMIETGIYPHQKGFIPIYWEQAENRRLDINRSDLYGMYYAYSVGGHMNQNGVKKLYNDLAQYYARHFGVQHVYKLQDKRSFVPDRTTI